MLISKEKSKDMLMWKIR